MSVKPGLHKGEDLKGKVALITGGARNIGRAMALSLSAGGASIMINANTSAKEAEETAAMVRAAGGMAEVFIADVTDEAAVKRMVDETVHRFGRIDCVVNNAAIRAETPFADIPLTEWRRVLSIVLDGAFLTSQACLPHMIKAGGGSIVNIGGMTGHKGALNRAHVVAAKAGIAGMSKAMAMDLAANNITVNCVVPGTVDTQRGLPGAPPRPDHRAALPPAGRRAMPEEIASMVRFLCGPDARYVTGQSLHVNGGGLMP